MSKQNQTKISPSGRLKINEGMVKKGGINTKPTTAPPSRPQGQGGQAQTQSGRTGKK